MFIRIEGSLNTKMLRKKCQFYYYFHLRIKQTVLKINVLLELMWPIFFFESKRHLFCYNAYSCELNIERMRETNIRI